jgi:hypothetical protein
MRQTSVDADHCFTASQGRRRYTTLEQRSDTVRPSDFRGWRCVVTRLAARTWRWLYQFARTRPEVRHRRVRLLGDTSPNVDPASSTIPFVLLILLMRALLSMYRDDRPGHDRRDAPFTRSQRVTARVTAACHSTDDKAWSMTIQVDHDPTAVIRTMLAKQYN